MKSLVFVDMVSETNYFYLLKEVEDIKIQSQRPLKGKKSGAGATDPAAAVLVGSRPVTPSLTLHGGQRAPSSRGRNGPGAGRGLSGAALRTGVWSQVMRSHLVWPSSSQEQPCVHLGRRSLGARYLPLPRSYCPRPHVRKTQH